MINFHSFGFGHSDVKKNKKKTLETVYIFRTCQKDKKNIHSSFNGTFCVSSKRVLHFPQRLLFVFLIFFLVSWDASGHIHTCFKILLAGLFLKWIKCIYSIHPASLYLELGWCSSSLSREAQTSLPQSPLPALLRWFWGVLRPYKTVFPACPRFSSVSPPSRTCLMQLPREVSRIHPYWCPSYLNWLLSMWMCSDSTLSLHWITKVITSSLKDSPAIVKKTHLDLDLSVTTQSSSGQGRKVNCQFISIFTTTDNCPVLQELHWSVC